MDQHDKVANQTRIEQPAVSETSLPFWRRARQRLAAEFEQRRYLFDAAVQHINAAARHSDADVAGLTAALGLLVRYDEFICSQHAQTLDVVAQYGALLDRHSTGEL